MKITSTLFVGCIVFGGSCLLADGTQAPTTARATKFVFAQSAASSQVEETAGGAQAEQVAETAETVAGPGESAVIVPSTASAHEVFSRMRCVQHSSIWAGSPSFSSQLWCDYAAQRAKEDMRIYQNVFSSCPSDTCCREGGIVLHGKNGHVFHGLRRSSHSCNHSECGSNTCKKQGCGSTKDERLCDQTHLSRGKGSK